MWSSSLAIALGPGTPVVAAGEGIPVCEDMQAIAPILPDRGARGAARDSGTGGSTKAGSIGGSYYGLAAGKNCDEAPIQAREAHDLSGVRLAQFQLPRKTPQSTTKEDASPRYPYRPLVQHLKYQYAIGTESEVDYRRNRDLNNAVKDNALIVIPQLNGLIIYRPIDWLAGTLELVFDKEFPVHEESRVVLPDGTIQFPVKREWALFVDQGFVTIGKPAAPFEFNVGRRNYEDERHWLYDTSLDIGSAQLRLGRFRIEATGGREAAWDLNVLQNEVRDRIRTYMLYAEYRGIEDHKLAAYTIRRDFRALDEGHPLHIGARVLGTPSDKLNYWADLAFLRGTDVASRKFSGYGFDVGFTYRFALPSLSPSITIGYAFGTGDDNPGDGTNHEFRQTGLQSNEEKFAGVAKFKYYGETLDAELSNLKIFTIGFGFRPARNVTVDLVYHRYRLDKIAEELRGSQLTALMNQDESHLSKDVGSAFDIVIGLRRLFGVRRLGVDLRAGWFSPGDAFRIKEGDPDDPMFRPANKGAAIVVKLWY